MSSCCDGSVRDRIPGTYMKEQRVIEGKKGTRSSTGIPARRRRNARIERASGEGCKYRGRYVSSLPRSSDDDLLLSNYLWDGWKVALDWK